MRTILEQHTIPTTTIAAAVAAMTSMDDNLLVSFCNDFGLTPTADDALTTARFAADAVFRGAVDKAAVVAYVRKRLLGQAVVNAPIIVIGVPVVDTPDLTVVQVTDAEPDTSAAPVKYGRGRRKNGKSDFCKAVATIEAAGAAASRETVLQCLVASGIKQTSAVVYLWRYGKGERS